MRPQTTICAAILGLLLLPPGMAGQPSDPRIDELLTKVQQLEARVKSLESDASQRQRQQLAQNHPGPYNQMRARFEKDRQLYPGKENEIEGLYAITNANHAYPPTP